MKIPTPFLSRVALVVAILFIVPSCAHRHVSDDSSNLYIITLVTPAGVVKQQVPRLTAPPGDMSCETGINKTANWKDVGAAEADTLRLDPPDRRRSALLSVLTQEESAGRFHLTELEDTFPSVMATGPARRIRITMSAHGCTWPPEEVLALYEWVGARWEERGKAQFPEDWIVTAEINQLNSRFALGTAD